MCLIIKKGCIVMGLAIGLTLLTGCAKTESMNSVYEQALNSELSKSQARFLNRNIAEVFTSFQRQPDKISLLDKKNRVVWLYRVYDVLLDPQTGKAISPPGSFLLLDNRVRWQEEYYVNSDGIIYDIKISSRFVG